MSLLKRILLLDEALLLRVCRHQTPQATLLMRAVTHLADVRSLTFVGGLLLGGRDSRKRQLGLRLAMASGGAALLAQVFKRVLKRPRPSERIDGFTALVTNPDAFSFPSGHTAAAVALTVAWAGVGRGAATLVGLWAAMVGFSRVYLGAHYPMDVLAGGLLGLASGTATQLAI